MNKAQVLPLSQPVLCLAGRLALPWERKEIMRLLHAGRGGEGKKRKYTLQEIEVEGFRDSNSESEKQSCHGSDPEVSGAIV